MYQSQSYYDKNGIVASDDFERRYTATVWLNHYFPLAQTWSKDHGKDYMVNNEIVYAEDPAHYEALFAIIGKIDKLQFAISNVLEQLSW